MRKMKKLKDVCVKFDDGDWIESKDQSESGIRLIQTGNIGEGEFLEKTERTKYISEDTFERLKCEEVFSGDILVSRLPEPIGRACIIPFKTEKMITAVDCTICRVNEKVIRKEYLCYFMQSSAYYNQLKTKVTGTTRKRISRKNLGNIDLPILKLEDQDKIIRKLDCIKNIIYLKKKEILLLDNLIQSRFVEEFGDLKINPKKWKIKTFDEMTDLITDGEHATPRRTEEGIFLLSARNIMNHTIKLEDVDYIDQAEYDRISKRIHPKEGDVLISCSGTVGRCCSVPAELKFQMVRSVALLRFKNEINPIFAEYMITSDYLKEQIDRSKTQSSQANLFQGKIKKLKGFVPPIDLQNQFAAFVQQVNKSKFEVQKSLEKTQLLFDSLMQEYFG